MENELKNFCFDVLGDFMKPNAYSIRQDRKGEWQVLVLYPGLVFAPKEIIFDEWNRQTKGTKFENVNLFMPI